MVDTKVNVTVGELRKIISCQVSEALSFNKKKPSRSKKATTDQRAVIDNVREAISNAITVDVQNSVREAVGTSLKYSDLEIISEPPKTLVRFMNIDGVEGQDMIYLINVTKIL